MEQTIIYDYIDVTQDPVYQELSRLKKGQAIELDGIEVILNDVGLYEVITEFREDCFSELSKCYRCICEFIDEEMAVD